MEQITLDLPNKLAKTFYALSEKEKGFATSILSAWLKSKTKTEEQRMESKKKMLKLMANISRKAEERGLTDEILQEILNED